MSHGPLRQSAEAFLRRQWHHATALCLARVLKGGGRDASDFMQQLADFGLQLALALFDTIHQVGLDARAVHLQQRVEKLQGILLDYGECPA